MPSLRQLTAALLLAAAGPSMLYAQGDPPGPESVVVVANDAHPGSLEVARAYLQRRSIPEENLVVLTTEKRVKLPRETFNQTIWNPLLEELLDRGLVEGLDNGLDQHGRRSILLLQSRIKYLVLCYGMPYHITKDEVDELVDLPYRRQHFKGSQAGLVERFAEGNLSRDDASVDGELALLLKKESPLKGFYPNPLFNNRVPETVKDILRVTRLDGPSPRIVIGMMDSALQGEREGLKGRAYADEDSRTGNYADGNRWIADSAMIFRRLGYDLSHDRAPEVFAGDDRFDAPALYAGWYANKATGPFALPGFRFPAGAVAVHLHSFSARSLRRADQGWTGPFIEAGVGATLGNVAEPYLSLTHHFSLFFAALSTGWNFGDAAYMALPGLSWQAVAIGDPLYRPFSVGLEEQMAAIGDPAKILEDQYVVIRQARLLQQAGREDEALRLSGQGMLKAPGPALALYRAGLQLGDGDRAGALRSLSLVADLPPTDWSDWGLLAVVADQLLELDEPEKAFRIYQRLEKEPIPEQVLLAFLRRGIQAAEQAGEAGIAAEWQLRVTPPPPEDPVSESSPPKSP